MTTPRKKPPGHARAAAADEAPVLLTGFEPFGGETENPSLAIARALDGDTVAGRRIAGAVLPTEFARALPELDALIKRRRPRLVLAVGQAGGREGISLERVAINLIDARIADNAGAQPIDERVIADAPDAYFSTLPLKAMLKRLHEAQIPAALSHTAGTFVCNQVFFGIAHRLATKHRRMRGGFIHVPYLPEQAARHPGAPSLPLATMIEAVRICLETALITAEDLHFAAGTTH